MCLPLERSVEVSHMQNCYQGKTPNTRVLSWGREMSKDSNCLHRLDSGQHLLCLGCPPGLDSLSLDWVWAPLIPKRRQSSQ